MSEASFQIRINVDAEKGAIYVNSTSHEGGSTLIFPNFTDQVAALRDLSRLNPVIVPPKSDLATLNFPTEFKIRPNKIATSEKLARRFASLATGIHSRCFFENACSEEQAKKYQAALTLGRKLKTTLKVKIKEMEMIRKNRGIRRRHVVEEPIDLKSIIIEPVISTEPATTPAIKPPDKTIIEPATEPITEPAAQAVAEPITEPVIKPVTEPTTEATAELIIEPAIEPIEG